MIFINKKRIKVVKKDKDFPYQPDTYLLVSLTFSLCANCCFLKCLNINLYIQNTRAFSQINVDSDISSSRR